jgi:O-antigen/teichoic acid export membrane protein
VFGNIRYIVIIDILAMIVSLSLSLILIPRYGALGAAIGTCGTLVVHNILNHLGLKFTTSVNLFQWRYLIVYGSIVLGTAGLAVLQMLVSPPIYIGLAIAGVISLAILFVNRRVLNIQQTFPELLRFKVVRMLFATNQQEHESQS